MALLAREPVTRRGRLLAAPPTTVLISASLLRSFRCVPGCTACCLPFTVDFLPEECVEWPEQVAAFAGEWFKTRTVEVCGRHRLIWSYPAFRHPACPFLRPTREHGAPGCGFWPTPPLECAAAPQLLMSPRGRGTTVITSRPFGRGWAWKVPPRCEFGPCDEIPEVVDVGGKISLLRRYQRWASYFEVPTVIDQVIATITDLPRLARAGGPRLVPVPL